MCIPHKYNPLSSSPTYFLVIVLLTYQDMLLKPMIKERNFLKEVQFYEYVKSLGSHSSQSPAAFLPGYYGVLALHNEPSNSHVHRSKGDGCSDIFKTSNICVNGSEGKMSMYYIVLENVTKKFRRPCVLDLKIGRQVLHADHDYDITHALLHIYMYIYIYNGSHSLIFGYLKR